MTQTLELDLSKWVSVSVYAKMTGYHVEYARRLAREHKIPAVKLGQNYLVYIGDQESQESN